MDKIERNQILKDMNIEKDKFKAAWKAKMNDSYKNYDADTIRSFCINNNLTDTKQNNITNDLDAELNAIRADRNMHDTNFKEWVLKRMREGIPLDEDDLSRLRDLSKHNEYGENRRWSRTVTSIIELRPNIYVSVEWEEGLTEMQENAFYNQPQFVQKKEIEKTIVVTTYDPIDIKDIDFGDEEVEYDDEEIEL